MLNKVILQGRLCDNPQMGCTQTGVEYANFRIAVERNYSKDNNENKTDFINCRVWKQSAAFLNKYFHKGDGILVEGQLQTYQYIDNDGQNRYGTQVNVLNINFELGKKSTVAASPDVVSTVPEVTAAPTVDELTVEEDLPF